MIPKFLKRPFRFLKHKSHGAHRHIVKAVFGITAFLLIITAISAGVYISMRLQEYQNKIYPHVSIDGVDVSGKTQQEALSLFEDRERKLKSVTIHADYNNQRIATFSADQTKLRTNAPDIVAQAFMLGRSPHLPTKIKEQVELVLGWKRYELPLTVQYETGIFDEFIQETSETYDTKPKDALFEFKDGKVTSFREDEKGLVIDQERFKNDMTKALEEVKQKPESKIIVVRSKRIDPEVTLAKANQFGIEELIGEGESDYSGSSADRIYNLTLAASKFHGVLIPAGEEFSFNKIIGDISTSTGYRPSYIIKNGKTVLGDGGGVCQVSTTAFRAALHTGLPIVERHAHAYRVSYYENDAKPGFDATIYTPDVDLRFKNDTNAHILVQTSIDKDNNMLYFRFYGKKDERRVELSEATVWDIAPPPPDRMEDDPNLPSGTVKQVDYAAWGAKSKFTYKVVKGDTITFEEEFYSSYRPWQAVFLVGKGP